MHEAPTPAVTPARDARSRAARTALQGLVSTVLVAVAALTLDMVTPGEIIEWATYGAAVGTAALTAVGAWAHRRLEAYLGRG